MKLIVFLTSLIMGIVILAKSLRKYLEAGLDDSLKGIPFPMWVHLLIFVVSLAAAVFLTMFAPR